MSQIVLPHQPVRVSRVDRSSVDVLLPGSNRCRAHLAAPLRAAAAVDPAAAPCVGDLVLLAERPDGAVEVVEVRPRHGTVVRTSVTPGSSHRQLLAANLDVVLVVEPVVPDIKPGRLERLLTLAWESGAAPVVVLTKVDALAPVVSRGPTGRGRAPDGPDLDAVLEEVSLTALGVEVVATSALTGQGVDRLAQLLPPGCVAGLLGPSGAGKSTLVNALAGDEVMTTRELRGDGKGRHTTVHRELVELPWGAMLVDTPGLRAIGLTDVEESLDRVFADVEELAALCRFSDCRHLSEPGCCVLEAVDAGALSERRLASYRKLQREAQWIAGRTDARVRAEAAARWKRISREARGRARP